MNKWLPKVILGVLLLSSCTVSASTMTTTQNMFFGTWVPTAASGNISLTTSGTTTQSGVSAAPSGSSAYQAILRFSSTGTLGAVLDVITLTPLSSAVTLSNGSGGTVTVGNFAPQTGLGVTLLNPTVNIPMGGRLTFSGTPSGTYTGSLQVQGSGLLSGTATATVPISVVFWQTLVVTQQTRLNFGAVEVISGAGTVRIVPQTGIRTVVSGAGNINLVSSPTPTAGSFLVKGQPNAAVTVTLPATATITGSNGGTMTVNNFTKFPTTTTLDATGNLTLNVGADLMVGANQTAGTYTGTYTVTVNY